MTLTLKKTVFVGCRWSPVNGGLGTTETQLPPGTRVKSVGRDGDFWKVVSNTQAWHCCGNHEYKANVHGRSFSTTETFAANHS